MFTTIFEKLKNNAILKWYRNIMLTFDCMVNALTFGDPRETLSSVFGKMKTDGNCILCSGLCKLLSIVFVDPDHCNKSILKGIGRGADNDMSPIPGLRRKWSNGFVILIVVMFFFQVQVLDFLSMIITAGMSAL